MSDVVFITPNLEGTIVSEPIGVLILATILKEASISSEIVHIVRSDIYEIDQTDNQFYEFMDIMENKIITTGANIVSFYTRCDVYHLQIKLAQRLKERHPELYVIFGGPHSDLCAEETLKDIPWVDYICRGEGETTIVPFFRSLLSNHVDESIAGLAFIRNGKIVNNKRPKLIDNLDSLPSIDYSLSGSLDKTSEYFCIDVGRGCPFGCTYCSTKSFWQRCYRLKSAERIVSEIQELHNLYGARYFAFEHDMFTLDKKKVYRICQMLKDLDFKINWNCSARVDCVDESLIDAMVDAGMTHIFFGIETGSPRMQKLTNKNLKLDRVTEIMRYVCSKGIKVYTSFIYGFPQETDEDISLTTELCMDLLQIPEMTVYTHLCTFLPGTELFNVYKNQLVRSNTISNMACGFGVKACEALISSSPALFPQFYEFHTPLRDRLKYYSTFIDAYAVFQPIYKYIFEHYYSDKLAITMYYDWTECNSEVLLSYGDNADNLHSQDIFRQNNDMFLERFANDQRFELLKEVARFVKTRILRKLKQQYHDSATDVYAFCVDDYLNHKKIEEYSPGMTISYTVLDNGRKKYTYKINRM